VCLRQYYFVNLLLSCSLFLVFFCLKYPNKIHYNCVAVWLSYHFGVFPLFMYTQNLKCMEYFYIGNIVICMLQPLNLCVGTSL